MQDTAIINTQLNASTPNSLWFVEENLDAEQLPHLAQAFKGTIVSNRFTLANTLSASFSDFEFPNTAFDHVFFRIAKEKRINLHILQESLKRLPVDGKLTLMGYKNDGMKSLVDRVKKNYPNSCSFTLEKHAKQFQLLCVTKESSDKHESEPGLEHYHAQESFQTPALIGDRQSPIHYESKPGQFGWNKVDKGSVFLIESAVALITQSQANATENKQPLKALDLGCGYGFIAMQLHAAGITHIDATDNCAAAISSCTENFKKQSINGVCKPSHIGNTLSNNHYDIVMCNPPFHQGFDHQKSLTESFVKAAADKLKVGGRAYFVVNEFIGLEKEANKYFTKTEFLDKKGGFKVIMLHKCAN